MNLGSLLAFRIRPKRPNKTTDAPNGIAIGFYFPFFAGSCFCATAAAYLLCDNRENYPPSKHTTIHYSCVYAPFLSCIYLCAPLFIHWNGLHTPPCWRAERWPILPLGRVCIFRKFQIHFFAAWILSVCIFSLIWAFVFEFVCLGKRCCHERLHVGNCRNLCM